MRCEQLPGAGVSDWQERFARAHRRALAQDPFILFPRAVSPHYHDLIIAQCVSAGLSPLSGHEARMWQTVVSMVESGMGVARVPQTLREIHSERVVFRELTEPALESQVLLLRRTGDTQPLMQAFQRISAGGFRPVTLKGRNFQ
ncbi:LysR substrate-binding domain-containing protein [Paraburkholderia sp. LEh10]|uniref:LysR substrate-binding domain-containing protein n=1 Tax=Paraburkholderia sp. LEh10 TaxID=2821353 RepID=UPI001FD7C19A|nr:LysR substrate-binding domain-containing protein [Paraburkholderia sp. LEh10]